MNGAGSLAGTALTLGLIGVTLGVAGRTFQGTSNELRRMQRRKRNGFRIPRII